MAPKHAAEAPSPPVEPHLYAIRGHKVIVDADLARMYGVTTGQFNQALKRNFRRFPPDFAFQLTEDEAKVLMSQNVISKIPEVTGDQIERRGGRRKLPWAFTEHGAVMAANVLRSDRAVRMSVFVVRAFVRMREQIAANQSILARLAEIDEKLLEHDDALRDLYEKLLLMLEPPEDPRPSGRWDFSERSRSNDEELTFPSSASPERGEG
jgi:hypothetical protein